MEKERSSRSNSVLIVRTALFAAGIAIAIYGFSVIAVIGTGHWFQFTPILIGAGFVLLGLLAPFLARYRVLAWIVLIAIAAVLLNVGVFEAKLIREARTEPVDDADWVIILGAKVNISTPSLSLANRCRAAVAYLNENPRTRAVATGGKGADEWIAESLATKIYLQSEGIDAARVLTEEKSTSTQENFRFAREAIEAAGGSADDSVVIVTSAFHVYRAKKLAAAAGFTDVSAKGSKDLPLLVPYYYFREYAANLFGTVAGHF